MKINPGNARGLLVPQGDRPFSFVVYSSEIRDFGNQIKLSPEKEMVDDMLAIVHTFSCRLDGMRKYEKNLKEDYPDVTKTTVELD